MFKSEFMQILDERGFLHQQTDAIACDELFATERVSAYIGFDPTAPSLHVGSLVQIMMLHWLAHTGHTPVVVLGGATGLVGDPSFKSETRSLLTQETVDANIIGITNSIDRALGWSGGPVVNNADWVSKLNWMDVLRDVGRHFTVNQMLAMDSVKSRIGDGGSLSFLEFNYMIMQALDFVELNRRHGVRVQLGGSDQWGNIINGIHLSHRMGGQQLFGITTPLLTTANGDKMGKTAKGAIWLNEDQLPDFDFWQFWRNTDDRDVHRFLKLFTTISVDEIDAMTDINNAKIVLANSVTELVRGAEAATRAQMTANAAFGLGGSENLPVITVQAGMGLARALVDNGVLGSVSEVRRFASNGAIRVNDIPVDDPLIPFATGTHRLSVGKKRHFRVEVE